MLDSASWPLCDEGGSTFDDSSLITDYFETIKVTAFTMCWLRSDLLQDNNHLFLKTDKIGNAVDVKAPKKDLTLPVVH